MEWKVDGSRHKLDRPPSSSRTLPIQQARPKEQRLWGTLTILSLFAWTAMANLEPLKAASGSSASMEKNSMETPYQAAWNHRHGKSVAMQDLSTPKILRAGRSASRSRNAKRNSRRPGYGPCRVHRVSIDVRDLGLGYVTDESVSFQYCSGTCESSRTNYDHVMNYIIQQRIVVPMEKNFVSKPCCRPIEFENFSFLDAYSVWQTVENGSATKCVCLG